MDYEAQDSLNQDAVNAQYDRDREMAMDAESHHISDSDVGMEDDNDSLWKETLKMEIEELDMRIGQMEWSIEQDGKTLQKMIAEKKHKEELLEKDNNF